MLGALVADAISMPVHWYYDTDLLDRDYPLLNPYQAPRNPHPDSILWRSSYRPRNKLADILHDQAQYWGQRGIHYHQLLPAGENTLNFLLGIQLYKSIVATGQYNPEKWLDLYIDSMRTKGWHQDTYIEEYHRAFFDNLAQGKAARDCGVEDIHIGGLTPVPFLLAGLDVVSERSLEEDLRIVSKHLALTHHGRAIASAGRAFVEIIHAVVAGMPLREAIIQNKTVSIKESQLLAWAVQSDRIVVGRHLTSACYLPDAFAASLYLAWKYHDDFTAGVIANARCGGDNAHRGVVVGSLLAAANSIPECWLRDLKSIGRLRCDTLRAAH
jgi:ADP-ribosylglycohydrolase